MELKYQGKTKDVYQLDNYRVLLKFKDDVTGTDGTFDPGANTVGLSIDGVGKSGLKMSTYFFELFNSMGIRTHFISSDLDDVSMEARDAYMFGQGLEVICRYRAVGSFYRRYAPYIKEEGMPLDSLIEITVKDDERGDPLINQDALIMLGVLTKEEYEYLTTSTVKICGIIKEELAKKGMELYDLKLEFGRDKETNEIMLIDEVSGGNMRVYKDEVSVKPLELEQLFLAK